MHRTQIQLDEASYRALRAQAFASGRSLAAVVREAVATYLAGAQKRRRRPTIRDFTFLRAGRSGGPSDIAVNHDKYLAEDFLK